MSTRKERGHSTAEYTVCLSGVVGLIALVIFPQMATLMKDVMMERMCEPLLRFGDMAANLWESSKLDWMPRTLP